MTINELLEALPDCKAVLVEVQLTAVHSVLIPIAKAKAKKTFQTFIDLELGNEKSYGHIDKDNQLVIGWLVTQAR